MVENVELTAEIALKSLFVKQVTLLPLPVCIFDICVADAGRRRAMSSVADLSWHVEKCGVKSRCQLFSFKSYFYFRFVFSTFCLVDVGRAMSSVAGFSREWSKVWG